MFTNADAIFDALPIPAYLTDATENGTFHCVNAAFATLVGYSKTDIIKRINASLLYVKPNQRADWLKKVRQGNGGAVAFPVQLRRKDRSVIHVHDVSRTVALTGSRNESNDIALILGVLIDATTLARAERLIAVACWWNWYQSQWESGL